MKQVIGQQGEVVIIKIDAIPSTPTTSLKKDAKGFIISHSESGHHHILTGGDVMERSDPPAGMKIFYAILDAPERFVQDAANPHGHFDLAPGVYEFRVSREYDPFSEQARRVAD